MYNFFQKGTGEKMQKQQYITIKDQTIPIVVRTYKTARHLKMYFKANVLYVSKPRYVSIKNALVFVEENKEEIYQLFLRLNSNENTNVKKWTTGESFLLKGEEYSINAKENSSNKINLQIDNEKKELVITYPANLTEEERKYNIDKGVIKLLRYNTEIFLETRVPYWSKITNIPYNQFKVNDATSKYGSCLPNKKVMHFSSRLIMLPEDKIDAIIVHELCHIVYPNHSKDFYHLVKEYIPNYDEINKWLKKNGKIILF